MNWGPLEDKLKGLARRDKNIKLPDIPDPPEQFEWLWKCFAHLHNSRSSGFETPEPISFLEFKAYTELKGISGEDREFLFDVVFGLDHEYKEWERKRPKPNG